MRRSEDDASVRVTVDVAVEPARAFEVFTTEVADWYLRDEHTLPDHTRTKTIRFEPRVGGRFVDVYDLDTGEGAELGRITVWEPPTRLVFVGDRGVEVDVSFAPSGSGCAVTVEERGLDHMTAADAAHVRRWGWHRFLPVWFAEHVAPVTRSGRS